MYTFIKKILSDNDNRKYIELDFNLCSADAGGQKMKKVYFTFLFGHFIAVYICVTQMHNINSTHTLSSHSKLNITRVKGKIKRYFLASKSEKVNIIFIPSPNVNHLSIGTKEKEIIFDDNL